MKRAWMTTRDSDDHNRLEDLERRLDEIWKKLLKKKES